MRLHILPIMFGWILSIWMPVPAMVRSVAVKVVKVATQGAKVLVATIQARVNDEDI